MPDTASASSTWLDHNWPIVIGTFLIIGLLGLSTYYSAMASRNARKDALACKVNCAIYSQYAAMTTGISGVLLLVLLVLYLARRPAVRALNKRVKVN